MNIIIDFDYGQKEKSSKLENIKSPIIIKNPSKPWNF